MAKELETAKKTRKVQRSLFTKSLNSFTEKCASADSTLPEKRIAFQLLELRMSELDAVSGSCIELMIKENVTDEMIQTEAEAQDEYKVSFFRAQAKMASLEGNPNVRNAQSNVVVGPRAAEKPFKRPFLEIPKFDGSISKWLQFWSHFKKIHEDAGVSDEDKLAYLKQVMEKDSKAASIVESYPTTGDNYRDAFASLKN